MARHADDAAHDNQQWTASSRAKKRLCDLILALRCVDNFQNMRCSPSGALDTHRAGTVREHMAPLPFLGGLVARLLPVRQRGTNRPFEPSPGLWAGSERPGEVGACGFGFRRCMASTQCLSDRLVPSITDPVRTEKYFLHAMQRYGVGLSFGTRAFRVFRLHLPTRSSSRCSGQSELRPPRHVLRCQRLQSWTTRRPGRFLL